MVLRLSYILTFFLTLGLVAQAAEEWTGTIHFNDGKIEPREITVPAGTRLVFELINDGASPAEFESRELSKEKVVAGHSRATLVIKQLDAGRYEFVDDFHPDAAPLLIIAQ